MKTMKKPIEFSPSELAFDRLSNIEEDLQTIGDQMIKLETENRRLHRSVQDLVNIAHSYNGVEIQEVLSRIEKRHGIRPK